MTTQFVGLKEFRQNLATYSAQVATRKIRLVVLKKNKPLLEVRGLDERTSSLEQLVRDISEARDDVRHGRVYTTAQVRKHLGL
jgi:PHD/YefM family antitoxin component YafN of YafNO toxin-antitoxin module